MCFVSALLRIANVPQATNGCITGKSCISPSPYQ